MNSNATVAMKGKTMGRKYWLLVERVDGKWSEQFGSYDKSDVTYERQDKRDHGVKASDLTIKSIQLKPRERLTQAHTNAVIEELNA